MSSSSTVLSTFMVAGMHTEFAHHVDTTLHFEKLSLSQRDEDGVEHVVLLDRDQLLGLQAQVKGH